jgi:hypothetical protein
MDNAGVQKKETGNTASVFSTVWDPFWFMRAVMSWGRSQDAPSFEVEETDDTFVCKAKVKLALPDHVDVAHAKAELDNGELTLVVPKAAAAPEPAAAPERAAAPEPESPPQRKGRSKGNGSGSSGRNHRRGARTRARRG